MEFNCIHVICIVAIRSLFQFVGMACYFESINVVLGSKTFVSEYMHKTNRIYNMK